MMEDVFRSDAEFIELEATNAFVYLTVACGTYRSILATMWSIALSLRHPDYGGMGLLKRVCVQG